MQLFKLFIPTNKLIFVFVETIFLALAYVAAGYAFYGLDLMNTLYLEENGFARLAFHLGFTTFAFYLGNLYTEIRIRERVRLLQQICFVLGMGFLSQALLDYVYPRAVLPKWMMIFGSVAALAVVYVWRLVYTKASTTNELGSQRFLFVGTSPMVFQLAEYLYRHPELGMTPLGYLDEKAGGTRKTPLPRLGTVDDLDETIRKIQPNCVAVGLLDDRCVSTERLVDLRFSGMRVEDVPQLYEVTFGKVCVSEQPLWDTVFSSGSPAKRLPSQNKIGISAFLGLMGLILFAPLLAAIALTSRALAGGPVIERRKRIGLHQRTFELLDFRIAARTQWLRTLHLEHLPRLFNLLRGDVTLIGPQPECPEFFDILKTLVPYYCQRCCVPPGLLGWAAVHAPGNPDLENTDDNRRPVSRRYSSIDTLNALEYDLYYVKHASLAMDIYILLFAFKWR